MFEISATDLAVKPAAFRYVYYILTSVNLKSYRTWRKEGEPNPFVGKTYRQKVTERVEFVDIFADDLGAQPHCQKRR